MNEPSILIFQDSARAMIADLAVSYGINFTPKESDALSVALAEVAKARWDKRKAKI